MCSSSSRKGKRNGQNRIGSKFGFGPSKLIFCTIEHFNHKLIDLLLFGDVFTNESGANDVIDVEYCFGNTFPHKQRFVVISEFKSLVFASRGAWWNCGSKNTKRCLDVNLDSGVAAGVKDLASFDILNGRVLHFYSFELNLKQN
jgi:hypothetical protein